MNSRGGGRGGIQDSEKEKKKTHGSLKISF